MTLQTLFIVYAVIISLAIIYALINLFHVLRHGHLDAKSYFVTGIFVAGFLLILGISATYLFTIEWATPLTFDLFGSSPTNNFNTGTQF